MKVEHLKIVHLSGVLNRGGGENHIINLTDGLSKLNQNSTVYCPSSSQLAKELRDKKLKVQSTKMRFKADPLFFLNFGKYCRDNHVDVIHVHDPVAMFLIILSSYFYKMPTAVLSKKTSFPIKKRKRTMYKYNHPIFKKIICVSKEVARVTALSIANKNKIVTIYNGSNLSLLSNVKSKFEIRSHLNLPKETKLIIHIANHTKPKDLPTLVKVINELKHRNDLHFIQIGRPTEQSTQIMDDLKRLNLESSITFLGELENASVYLKQADISLITSKSEGLPQVIYESLYYKVPIISTKAGGISEVIVHNKSGFLADVGDYMGLTAHIKSILNKEVELDEMLELNFDLVQKKYDSTIMAQKTLDLYKDVLDKSRSKKAIYG
jgi:glycosyltransferase involved in cell wall biosynthesis